MKYFVIHPQGYSQPGYEFQEFDEKQDVVAFIERHIQKWDYDLSRYTVIKGEEKELVPKEKIKSVEIK